MERCGEQRGEVESPWIEGRLLGSGIYLSFLYMAHGQVLSAGLGALIEQMACRIGFLFFFFFIYKGLIKLKLRYKIKKNKKQIICISPFLGLFVDCLGPSLWFPFLCG